MSKAFVIIHTSSTQFQINIYLGKRQEIRLDEFIQFMVICPKSIKIGSQKATEQTNFANRGFQGR